MQDKRYRLLDANLNRTAEGLRVLEDLARFYYNDAVLTEKIKTLRHQVRKNLALLQQDCLNARDVDKDTGFIISQATMLDQKADLAALVTANCKRGEESLRVVEEMLKVLGYDALSKQYERHRFEVYLLEKEFEGLLLQREKKACLSTDLYGLTGEAYSLGRTNVEVVAAMIEAGIEIIQYREKEKKMLAKYEECLQLREMTRKAEVTFLINDDIHLALAVDADGVHIGQDDLPLEQVRDLLGAAKIIGLSTHNPEQAEDAVRRGADYIGVGPIFATQTKKDVCAAVGFEYLDYVATHIPIPFVAIGGIKEQNIAEVQQHGAQMIALVTEIVGAEDIGLKIKNLRRRLHESDTDGSSKSGNHYRTNEQSGGKGKDAAGKAEGISSHRAGSDTGQ